MMTKPQVVKDLMRDNPSAVYIDFTQNPSTRDLLQSIKSSSNLTILAEKEDYAVIVKKRDDSCFKIKSPITGELSIPKSTRAKLKLFWRYKQKEPIFIQTLKGLGIQVTPINSAEENGGQIVNACGIMFWAQP